MILIKQLTRRISFSAKMSQIVKRDAERVQRVQQNVIRHEYEVEVEAKLRQKLTIESSIDQLENEMRSEISRALKQSELKVVFLLEKANKMRRELEIGGSSEKVKQYNNLVGACEKARWEFMVHRQAVGFTIRNYQLVTSMYPIPPRLPQE